MTALHDFQEDIDAIGRSTVIPTLLETVLLATGMGFAAIARVTDSRWVTCRALDQISFGLNSGDELEVESTLCYEVMRYDHEIVIDDVRSDPVYVNHHCPTRYGFRSYISVPIRRADGSFFGTLCAIDPEPGNLKQDRVLSIFRLFAKLVGEHLDAEEALALNRSALTRERELAEVQEQFIAILAHDLRNPVAALSAGLRLIERRAIDEKATELVGFMRGSVNRMGLLIENLLDQARRRSGDGIVIERRVTEELGGSLHQIIAELQATAPDRAIEADIDLCRPVDCDVARVSQLFSNLLANAITHGTEGSPVRVEARISGDDFVLSVTNEGAKIPDAQLPDLFRPFEGRSDPQGGGLGLGLFIASEIANGHGGALNVISDDTRTVFTFRMPNCRLLKAGE